MTPPPPPQPSYPLTPPPTGGLDKLDGYMNFKTVHTRSKHLGEHIEDESPTGFFEDCREGSDIDLNDFEEEPMSLTNDTAPTSPASESSNQSATITNTTTNECGLLKLLTKRIEATSVTEPFPLLKLPLFVRQTVYEHLLVVPGLLCVRQKHTGSHGTKEPSVHPEDRVLIPGIASSLAQVIVDGHNIGFSCFASTNINILLASKEVHAEAKAVIYTRNNFNIVRPSAELSPPSDCSVRLFPPGCQRLVTKLNIRIRSFYDLHWLLSGGYNDIKNFYRGLRTLTLILELDSLSKGFARQWAKHEGEKWSMYIKRLQIEIAKDAFAAINVATSKAKQVKNIPSWINLRVLFHGESYDETLKGASVAVTEQVKRDELRNALVQAWELFKKGGR
jgi:hypothetical protein